MEMVEERGIKMIQSIKEKEEHIMNRNVIVECIIALFSIFVLGLMYWVIVLR